MTNPHFRLASLWRGHRWLLVAIVVIRLGVAATWIVQAVASASIFTLLTSHLAPPDVSSFSAPALVLALALILRPLLVVVGQMVAHSAMTLVKRDLRVRVLTAVVVTSARDSRGRSGRDHAMVVDGIENLDAYLSGYLPQLIVTVLTVGGIGGAIVVLNPAVGAVVSVIALSVPLLPRLWSRVLARRGGDQWEAYQDLHAEFVDSMHGMTTLVAFGAEVRREHQLAAASAALLKRTIAQLRLSLVDSGLASLALVGAPAAVLLVLFVQRGDPSPIIVFTLVLLSIELVRPLRDLASLWHAGYVGTFSGSAILALLGNERAVPNADGEPRAAPILNIEVRDVVVRYPGSNESSLEVDRLLFKAGLTAIVGPSGAGKSTLGATIVGLSLPETGSVLMDGGVVAPDVLLRTVSLVPQDPALFGGTVAQEISRGAENLTQAMIDEAATEAGIGSDDATLSLASAVGEGGALLSGGQRQRVAIARALVQQRQVLVLDEATSALDPASEAALLERLRRRGGRILIAITHRAAVAEMADRVITVEQGRVVSIVSKDDRAEVAPS